MEMTPMGDSALGTADAGGTPGDLASRKDSPWGHDGGAKPGREIRWRRMQGVVLLGAVPGSDPAQRLFLVRRPDGRAVQLSELLYLIVGAAGHERTTEALSLEVSRICGRKVTTVGLIHLIDRELRPLGLIEHAVDMET